MKRQGRRSRSRWGTTIDKMEMAGDMEVNGDMVMSGYDDKN